MNKFKIIFILVLFVLEISIIKATKWKCKPVICSPCEFHIDDTFTAVALRALNAGLPSDGSCITGQKYIHIGTAFGKLNNACCCLPIAPSEPVECNPRGLGVLNCPDNLGIEKTETIGEYYSRVARVQKDAPSNGCCRAGTFKYIFPAMYTGLSHDVCACMIENQAFAPDRFGSSTSSSSSTSLEKS